MKHENKPHSPPGWTQLPDNYGKTGFGAFAGGALLWGFTISLSLALHAAVFFAVLWKQPKVEQPPELMAGVMMVELQAPPPEPEPEPKPEPKVVERKPEPKPVEQPKFVEKKPVETVDKKPDLVKPPEKPKPEPKKPEPKPEPKKPEPKKPEPKPEPKKPEPKKPEPKPKKSEIKKQKDVAAKKRTESTPQRQGQQGTSSRTSGGSVKGWQSEVAKIISRNIGQLRGKGKEKRVVVAVQISGSGQLIDVSMAQPSVYEKLNMIAMKKVRRRKTYPAPPGGRAQTVHVAIAVR